MVRALRLCAVVAIAVMLGACGSGSSLGCGAAVSAVDRTWPQASGLTSLDGRAIDLAAYGSGTTVVNVWGAWCGPCRAEAPELVATERDLAASGVRFLGIDVRDNRAQAEAFQQEFGIRWPSVFDDSSALTAKLTNLSAPPITLVVHDGRIRAQIFGQTNAKALRCAIDAATKAPKGTR